MHRSGTLAQQVFNGCGNEPIDSPGSNRFTDRCRGSGWLWMGLANADPLPMGCSFAPNSCRLSQAAMALAGAPVPWKPAWKPATGNRRKALATVGKRLVGTPVASGSRVTPQRCAAFAKLAKPGALSAMGERHRWPSRGDLIQRLRWICRTARGRSAPGDQRGVRQSHNRDQHS